MINGIIRFAWCLKYPPCNKKRSLLNHPKTSLAISQNKKWVCSDVSGTLGWVECKQKALTLRDIRWQAIACVAAGERWRWRLLRGRKWGGQWPRHMLILSFPVWLHWFPSPCLSRRRRGKDLCSFSASTKVLWPCFFNCADETGWLLINVAFGLNDRSNFTYCDERLWKSKAQSETVPESFRSF